MLRQEGQYASLNRVLIDRHVEKKTKYLIERRLVWPIITHGSKVWKNKENWA